MAIVPTSAGPRALFCFEMTEVLFAMRVFVPQSEGVVTLPALFLETIEEGSARPFSVVPEAATAVGATVHQGKLYVHREVDCPVHVIVAGVRQGRAGVNLPERTVEEMTNNNNNWSVLSGAGRVALMPQRPGDDGAARYLKQSS